MFSKEIIDLVIRQTNYDENLAIEKLEKWNGNFENVIKEYLNPNFQEKKKVYKSKNQKVMGALRDFMDDITIQYEKRKKEKEENKLKMEIEKERQRQRREFERKIEEEKEIYELNKVKDQQNKKRKQMEENAIDGINIKEI
tara:strand:+ start:242 stop:664 length:423 start_codon:yes stop_codon:yes gene_type:complete